MRGRESRRASHRKSQHQQHRKAQQQHRKAHRVRGLLSCLALLCLLVGCGAAERSDVLVLVNGESPVSRAIGEYYRVARRIPKSHVLTLFLPMQDPSARGADDENISREDFDARIRAPVERFLEERGWVDAIETIVTTRGMPLRITGRWVPFDELLHRGTQASVDAELALLFSDRSRPGGVAGAVNPYFDSDLSLREFRRRHPGVPPRYGVARLTGYAEPVDSVSGVPADVKALVDCAQAEPASGRWVVDQDPGRPPGTDVGNLILLAPAAAALASLGADVLDERTDTFVAGVESVLGYASWGSNDHGSPEPLVYGEQEGRVLPGRFAPRSVAIDLVSTNARSFAWPPEYGQSLVADLVRAGVCGAAGHVNEPTLSGVARPAIFLRRFAEGVPAAEAYLRSLPFLGWTNVYVGDPLMTVGEALSATRAGARDFDRDGVDDASDNCKGLPNPVQRDTDDDGFGNLCDADVNQSGAVTTSWGAVFLDGDRGDVEWIERSVRLSLYDPDHDLDGDGDVDAGDLSISLLGVFRPPGPAAERRAAER